ncbi:hypothetical protein [Butyrivibrio sp. WCD2001]|uniref:hypothetical protein n=1 Tax=Butyrivibrio sp. WCD2001 TaxID=1280681 RepID=UPI00041499BD|nr:hypothetical protein [Butyrivibrio sp. WCD2001]
MGNRDDFAEHVKNVLRDRVGGFCSNPSCQAPTTGPHTDPSKKTSIGKAAHITAAAPGGPRYNPDLTPKQRSSADNGIWLCSNCADLIDKDEVSYPIDTLLTWKAQAELEQRKRLLNPNYRGGSTTINNHVVINAAPNNNVIVTINLWKELGKNLEDYQHALDYAYGVWEGNFKDKYPNIHKCDDQMFNFEIQDLQNEIDAYGGNLYRDQFRIISKDFSDSKNALAETLSKLSIEMTKDLYDKMVEYMNCMMFHYETDGIGLVDYYWSSFFRCLDKNYKRMNELKNHIDSLVRKEYNAAKQKA